METAHPPALFQMSGWKKPAWIHGVEWKAVQESARVLRGKAGPERNPPAVTRLEALWFHGPKDLPEGDRSRLKMYTMVSLKASICCGVNDSPGN